MSTSPPSIRVEAREAVEQRRLAAAARAHDRDHLAGEDLHVDAAQRVHLDEARVVELLDGPRLDDSAGLRAGTLDVEILFGADCHRCRPPFPCFSVRIARRRVAIIGECRERASANYEPPTRDQPRAAVGARMLARSQNGGKPGGRYVYCRGEVVSAVALDAPLARRES